MTPAKLIQLMPFAPPNLLTYTEELDNAAWSKTLTTISANVASGRDGSLTADKIIPTAVAGQHLVNQQRTGLIAGGMYTLSCYAQADGYKHVALSEGNNTTGSVTFDASAGSIQATFAGTGGAYGEIRHLGSNLFFCWMTLKLVGTVHNCRIDILDDSAQASFTGDGTKGVIVWGAMLNAGNRPGRYRKHPL